MNSKNESKDNMELEEQEGIVMKETLLQITMWIVTICTYISYVPQIYKLYKTKHSEDLSVQSWLLWTVSALANTAYSIMLLRVELIIASVSEALLILVVLLQTLYYNRKNNVMIEETDEEFEARLKRIRSKDGNHMLLTTAMIEERNKRNQSKGNL